MNKDALDSSNLVGIVWREVLRGIFSTLGRIQSLANCRGHDLGRYSHKQIAHVLGVEETDRAIRTVHQLIWRDWLGGSLQQQKADFLSYLSDFDLDLQAVLTTWRDSREFLTLAPDAADAEERSLFRNNILLLLALFDQHEPRLATDSPVLGHALRVINKEYGKPELSLGELAVRVGMSERHLGRLFKEHTGRSFRQYLRDLRIKKAVALLSDRAHNVKAVAGMVGYKDAGHFGRDFRKCMARTPTELRAEGGMRGEVRLFTAQ